MLSSVLQRIMHHARLGADLRTRFFSNEAMRIASLALRMAYTLAQGNKLLFCGNGGSAADAQHIAAEFVCRFQLDRPSLPALALTTDTSVLTAIGNDFGFNQVFSRQVQGLGSPGDMLVAISTSGNSPNILEALTAAGQKGLYTVGLTGHAGGQVASMCDMHINVPEENTALVQEVHIAAGHLLCGLTDYFLFENVAALTPYLEGTQPLPL